MGNYGWRLSPIGDGGTHLQSWLDVSGCLSLSGQSDVGYCGKSDEACLDLRLGPILAQHGHPWHCEG